MMGLRGLPHLVVWWKRGKRAPSPARVEEPPIGTVAQEGATDHGKCPMMPLTVVGGSTEGEGTQAVSNDEVEEI